MSDNTLDILAVAPDDAPFITTLLVCPKKSPATSTTFKTVLLAATIIPLATLLDVFACAVDPISSNNCNCSTVNVPLLFASV